MYSKKFVVWNTLFRVTLRCNLTKSFDTTINCLFKQIIINLFNDVEIW